MQEFNTVWGPSNAYSIQVREGIFASTTLTVRYLHHRLESGDEVNVSGVFSATNAEISVLSPNMFSLTVPTPPSVFPTPVGGQPAPITIKCDSYSEVMRRPKIVRTTVPTGVTIEIQTMEAGEWVNQKTIVGNDTLTELNFMQLWDEVRLSRTVGTAVPITVAFYKTADMSVEPTPANTFDIPLDAGGGSLVEVGTPGTYDVVTTNEFGQVIAGTEGGGGGGLEDANLYITATNTSGVLIPKCAPVRMTGSTTIAMAQANSTLYKAVGIAFEPIANGATGKVLVEGTLAGTTAEWDAVSGSTGGLVTDGSTYFLSFTTAGRITSTIDVDAAPAGSNLVPMGFALSSTRFKLEIDAPTKL